MSPGLMLTNPNTLGIFDEQIAQIAEILHRKGGLLYMDGANMNALVAKARPGDFGVDVMHLNLHKTFSTPHGGGGPGSGPVACKTHLEPFLPTPSSSKPPTAPCASTTIARTPSDACAPSSATSACSSAPSPTSWPTAPTACARPPKTPCSTPTTCARNSKAPSIFPTTHPRCMRSSSATSCQAKHGIKTGDIAKRLIDYGFHPYTVSFPMVVHGALMIEPTESEPLEELDLFIDAMKSIAQEAIDSPELVRNAPHSTRLSRLDETAAARKPILRWKPEAK